tara:strand:- start:7753 stop:7944 length:192 start_codon:yes stop_codon:yes gene_type:complete
MYEGTKGLSPLEALRLNAVSIGASSAPTFNKRLSARKSSSALRRPLRLSSDCPFPLKTLRHHV